MQGSAYPPGYYPTGPQHGQFRPPSYPHVMHGSNPSFQSMTSHWNLSSPHALPGGYPPGHMMSGGSHMPPGSGHMTHGSSHMTSGSAHMGMNVSSRSKYGNQHAPQPLQQPKGPDRPLLPYMRYSRKMWEELKLEGKRVWEVGKIIGQKWRELAEEDKQPYLDAYESEKVVYLEQVKVYKNSTAYKRWLEAKQQADAAPPPSAPQHNEYGPPPPQVIAPPPRQSSADAHHAMMQQNQDSGEDEYITMKQVSSARFHRNHRLMLELFNSVPVPDMRSVVTKTRFNVLKKQVQSLQMHQRKLDEELKQFDVRFAVKKRKFLEDSENFKRELKKVHDNPPPHWKRPPQHLSSKDLLLSSSSSSSSGGGGGDKNSFIKIK